MSVTSLEPHKFPIGQRVFRPHDRSAEAVGGIFTIIGLAPHDKGEPNIDFTKPKRTEGK